MKFALWMIIWLSVLMLLPVRTLAETLPDKGETVFGFRVEEHIPCPLLDAEIVTFTHEKTGAQLVYIANDDVNRVFDLTFMTEAIDDTGLPHIFEHATLGGSQEYPSKALFFNLIYQTYNTYMNASTADVMTTYPVASLSEAQLLRLADVYTDSCFHPMVLEDESIFREEAWRYRLEGEEAPLTIEGTVYSEMLGAMTLQRMASYNTYRLLYPNSRSARISGGDPKHIPELSWEDVKAYHDQYYVPSNCVAFLYGKLEDYAAFLALLDNAFMTVESHAAPKQSAFPNQIPVGYREAEIPFSVEMGSDTKEGAVIQYAMACPGVTNDDRIKLSALAALLNDSASPLMQKLQTELPSGSFSCSWDDTTPVGTIVFSAAHVDREEAAHFRSIIGDVLASIAELGIEQEIAEAFSSAASLEIKLIRENPSAGLSFIQSMAYSLAATGDLQGYLRYIDALRQIDSWNEEGVFTALVQSQLMRPYAAALVTTFPNPGAKEQEDEALAKTLAKIKAGMSAEERSALIETATKPAENDDASALVARVQATTISSLPEEIRQYKINDHTDDDGVRWLEADAGVDQVAGVDVYIATGHIPQDDLHWARLYLDLLFSLDGETHTRADIAHLANRYLNSFSARMSALDRQGEAAPVLHLSWIAAAEDLKVSYQLADELLFHLRCADREKVLAGIQNARTSLKASITRAPYQTMLRRALARTQARYRYSMYVNDLDYYAFLVKTEQLAKEDFETLTRRLEKARGYFDHRTDLIIAAAGDQDALEANKSAAEAWAHRLVAQPGKAQIYAFPLPEASEALIIDSAVQYNGIVLDSQQERARCGGGFDVVSSVVTDAYLYPKLRDQFGAYGVIHAGDERTGIYVISYRDPNVPQTFAVYEELPAFVADLQIDETRLEGYMLSQYASLALPKGELSGAGEWISNVIEGLDPERSLQRMRDIKALTPQALQDYASLYKALIQEGTRFTAGGRSAIEQNKALYTCILDPFQGE